MYDEIMYDYRYKRSVGMKKEDARKILPLCTRTQLYLKCDARELFHIFDERLKPEAQKETRTCVKMMKKAVSEIHPWLIQLYDEEQK